MENNKTFLKKYKKESIILISLFLIFIIIAYFLLYRKIGINNNINKGFPNSRDFVFNENKQLENENNSNVNNEENSDDNNEENDDFYEDSYFEGLIKIWKDPVAGYSFYKTADKKTFIQFVDSKTGSIYEKNLAEPLSEPTKIADSSYKDIVKAYFINDDNDYKNRVIIQYLENSTIKTISAKIPENNSATKNIENINTLPDNIKYFTTSKDNKKAAYIVNRYKIVNDYNDIYTDWYFINDYKSTYGTKFNSSELYSWKLILLDNNDIYAYSTDTYFEKNNLYKVVKVNSISSTLEKIYGDHNGMSFLINNNNVVLSIFTGEGLKLYTKKDFSTLERFTDKDLTTTKLSTLANKCAISNDIVNPLIICAVPKEINSYDYGLPDAWYQGATTFDDDLYVINNFHPDGDLLFNIQDDSIYFDIIDAKNLSFNDEVSHLIFINKNDASLWSLNVYNILYKEL